LPLAVVAAVLLAGAARADSQKESPGEDEGPLQKEALALNDITGLTPLNGRLQQLTNDPAAGKKLLAVAAKMAKGKDQLFNRNATLLLALVGDSLKQVRPGAVFYRLNIEQSKALASEKGQVLAYLGLIEMYLENGKYAEGEKVCQEYLDLNAEEDSLIDLQRPRVERQQVLALYKLGKTDAALRKVEKLIGDDPRDWRLRELKARVLREAEKYDEAAKVYLEVIERVKRDRSLNEEGKKKGVALLRYSLSGVYVDMNKIDKASAELKALLEDDPDHPTYNNDLGYIWADRGMNLPEAEKMIRKALDEDRKRQTEARKAALKKNPDLKLDEVKDNAAYLDSMGWVLFKQNKAKEAKPYLEEAVKDPEGQHVEIYDHLGDVHWALGEKAEALAAWKKGLESVTPVKRDQRRKAEVEKKLKMKEEKSGG